MSAKHCCNGTEKKEKTTLDDPEDIYCGVGSCRPQSLQGCANIGCVTVALCLAGLCTSTLSIYINSQITTLERQFGFNSSVSGILLSCNDLGYLLTTLLASFLARRVHIPRALAASTLLFGLSGLLCAVPFFAARGDLPPTPHLVASSSSATYPSSPSLNASAASLDSRFHPVLCDLISGQLSAVTNGTAASACGVGPARPSSAMSEGFKTMAVVILGLGLIFQGFGKSPRQPFIGTYVDDNVPKTKTTLYLGIISSVSVLGPVLAFTLGGVFSRIYLTLEETSMTPSDPRWVGAWWMGFLLFGFLGILTAIPPFFFPRRLRPQPELRMLELQRKQSSNKERRCLYDAKEFFRTLLRLLSTPVYMLTVASVCISMFGVSGMMAFMAKFLETQYQIPTWKANMLLGIVNVTAAACGTLAGGVVTSRFKLRPVTCLKLIVVTSLVATVIVSMGFVLGCDQPFISMGASVSSWNKSPPLGANASQSSCSSTCLCDDTRFFPVCGRDGVTYFSPCHAGCTKSAGVGYRSCSCIKVTSADPLTNTSSPSSPLSLSLSVARATSESAKSSGQLPAAEPDARPGFCDSACVQLYPYIILNFFGALFSTFVIMPAWTVSVRSVSEADKPLAIGLSAFLSNLLGWFLGPIVFGRVVDSCCLLWSSGCGGSGSCSLYDIELFRNRYHGLMVAARLGSCLSYAVALLLALCGRATFHSHLDHPPSILATTAEAEAGDLVVARNGTSGQKNGADLCAAGEEEKETMLGGPQIYRGDQGV